MTRIRTAVVQILLAPWSQKPTHAQTLIRSPPVNARSPIFTRVGFALVNLVMTPFTRSALDALAPETTDFVVTVSVVVARLALALVQLFRTCQTGVPAVAHAVVAADEFATYAFVLGARTAGAFIDLQLAVHPFPRPSTSTLKSSHRIHTRPAIFTRLRFALYHFLVTPHPSIPVHTSTQKSIHLIEARPAIHARL